MTASSARSQPAELLHREQPERLAQIFRMSRLTMLIGAPLSGKTLLLKTRLLPCLARRASDRTTAGLRREGGVVYLPERRRESSTRDVPIYFDAWDHAPMRALTRVIDAALFDLFASQPDLHVPTVACGWLAEKLKAATMARNIRFLIVLDAFDVFLSRSEYSTGVLQFVEELIEVLNTPGLAVNVLIALRDDAEPAFERIQARVAEHADASLRMPPPREADPPPMLHAVIAELPLPNEPVVEPSPAMEAPAPVERAAARHQSSLVDSVMQVPAAAPSIPIETHRAFVGPKAEVESDADAAQPEAVRRRPHVFVSRAMLASTVLVTTLCAAFAWFLWGPSGEPSAVGAKAAINERAIDSVATNRNSTQVTTAEPTVVVPRHGEYALTVDIDSAVDARIAGQLRDRVAARAGMALKVRPARHWSEGFDRPGDPAQFAILRYDALQAARDERKQGRLTSSLQIVAPLYAEPILVLVRRAASIDYIHELEGRRINTGPASSARGMTATRFYRDLFGKPPSVGDASHDDEATALTKLVGDRGVDAMVVVGSDLDALFAGRPAAWKAAVKLLRLDRDHPTSRRAQRFFLSSLARADASAGLLRDDLPALAELTFLVSTAPEGTDAVAGLGDLALGLCANLPALQRDGDPKWREVQLDTRLDVGWPYAAAASEAFRACLKPRATAPAGR